jgi:hypothetical protein
MNERFAFAIWCGDDRVMAVGDYLRGRETGAISWEPDLADSALILWVGGIERMAENWNLGEFVLLLRQFEALVPRLRQGQEAIVRSAVNDQPVVPYLLFEPAGQHVRISLFLIDDPPHGYDYPIDLHPGMGQQLYTYVAAHKARLLAAGNDDTEQFRALPYAKTALLENIERENARGRQLLALLGQT